MGLRRACVAPRIGCIPDYLDEEGAFLYDAQDSLGLAGALREALAASDERLSRMGEHNRKLAEKLSWNVIAE